MESNLSSRVGFFFVYLFVKREPSLVWDTGLSQHFMMTLSFSNSKVYAAFIEHIV